MNFIKEKHLILPLCIEVNDFAYVILSCRYRRELKQLHIKCPRVNTRNGRLPCSRRPPQNERKSMLLLYGNAKRLPSSNKMILSNNLVEVCWTYPGGKWLHMFMVLLSPILCLIPYKLCRMNSNIVQRFQEEAHHSLAFSVHWP